VRSCRPRAVRRGAAAGEDPARAGDLETGIDQLHDTNDPSGVAARGREVPDHDGSRVIVARAAGDRVQVKPRPIGRLIAAASTTIGVPISLAPEVGAALGTRAGA
jgi:hypothetical protein